MSRENRVSITAKCADCGKVATHSVRGNKTSLPPGWRSKVRGLFHVTLCPQCSRKGKI